MKILFIGFGDIASRTAQRLTEKSLYEYTLYGLARSVKPAPKGVHLFQGAVANHETLRLIDQHEWDAVVLTFTPDGRDEKAYQKAYVENCQCLIDHWGKGVAPKYIVYVSSTGVYGQDDDGWVDESSPAEAASATSACLREAEKIIENSGIKHSIVRFSGIYGPGRDFLLRQVKAGKPGNKSFGNRIHQDDCAGFLAHLLKKSALGEGLECCYLASDSAPSTGTEVRQWLALQLGVTLEGEPSQLRAGSKKCSNRKMLGSGYQLLYPTYKHGYAAMLGLANISD